MALILIMTLAVVLSVTAKLILEHRRALTAGRKPRLLKATLSRMGIGPEYPVRTAIDYDKSKGAVVRPLPDPPPMSGPPYNWQDKLKKQQVAMGAEPTGRLDEQTAEAAKKAIVRLGELRMLQRWAGVTPDGRIGPKTVTAFEKKIREFYADEANKAAFNPELTTVSHEEITTRFDESMMVNKAVCILAEHYRRPVWMSDVQEERKMYESLRRRLG